MPQNSRFLITAAMSGSGKTTLTLGLLRAMKNRGVSCRPFKCGPDYIDTKYHDMAAGCNSVNLDLFLSSPGHVKTLYAKYSSPADVCITEGVMGLFDGYDRMQGSSAQIAELLDMPVILVINAKSMAYSAAAMLYGFKNFYPAINVAGVIFNFVGSESHYQFLKEACDDIGLEALGYLPKNSEIEIPSRHLGLTLDNKYRFDEFADKVAALVERYIDIDRLLEITRTDRPVYIPVPAINKSNFKISVASDEAFNFVYHENIEYLKQLGEVTFFSPINDRQLPVTDFLYLPGGYPELYLAQLSDNHAMRKSIRDYIDGGGKALAECGGMMYLCNSITDKEGTHYPMVGILDQEAGMQQMKLKLGYRSFRYNGMTIRGHEFHYSTLCRTDEKTVADTIIHNAKGAAVDTKLFRHKNLIAGYTHIYWADKDLMAIFEHNQK